MKRNYFFCVLICLLIIGHIHGQVTIGLELGGSYAPFTLYAATVENTSSRIDYLFGINGQVHLNDRLLLNARVSYVDREDFRWQDLCLCPDYLYSEYFQNDINLDVSTMYKLNKMISVGFGMSALKKINTEYVNNRINTVAIRSYNNFYYGLNGVLGIEWNRLYAKLVYIRRFKPDDLVYFPTKGQNRLDVTLGYNLFWSKGN